MGFPPLLNLSTRLSTAAWPGQTTKTAQTLEFMFQNVAYWPTVYRTGHAYYVSLHHFKQNLSCWGRVYFFPECTLESWIDVGQGINVGPGKFVKKNKRRALNKRRAWTKCAKLCYKKPIKLENICGPWKKVQNLINVGPLMRL